MSNSLLTEFMRGWDNRLSTLSETIDSSSCPFIATSNSADAWHAGQQHADNALRSAFDLSLLKPSKVWHGRGYLVNVLFSNPSNGQSVHCQYEIRYSDGKATAVYKPVYKVAA